MDTSLVITNTESTTPSARLFGGDRPRPIPAEPTTQPSFATDQPSYIDQERHSAVRKAARLVAQGRRDRALVVLARSVERQHRIAGGGTIPLPVCVCGRRACQHLAVS